MGLYSVKYNSHMNRRVRKSARYYKQSESCRWWTCLAASRMSVDELEELAEALNFHGTRHVRNYAMAGLTYRTLRHYGGSEVQMLRRGLTIGHFYQMGYLMNRFEISPYEAIEDLRTAMEEGVSKETMYSLVAEQHDAEVRYFEKEVELAINRVKRLHTYCRTKEQVIGVERAVGVLESLKEGADAA